MSGKKMNTVDMGLALSGSQIGTPSNSARRPGSSRGSTSGSRPGSASGAREKTNVNGCNKPSPGRQRSGSHGGGGGTSHRSNPGGGGGGGGGDSARSKHNTARDDFLAFFETTAPPKIMQPRQKTSSKPATKKAWASNQNSARSTTTVGSKQTATKSSASTKFSHSIFQPVSARTTSTVDEDDNYIEDYDYNSYDFRSPHEEENVQYSENARGKNKTPRSTSNDKLSLPIPGSAKSSGSVHGENDLYVSSQYDSSSHKATKLNSIANNMTSQALSPGNKAPFLGMENSYQNIKHKTPVNQVKQSAQNTQPQVGRNIAENYIKKCNMAATKIQRWYRRHRSRSFAGEAAIRRLLETKKQEKEDEMRRERERPRTQEADRQRTREDRARQARQDAIQELQKKREAKRAENQRMVDEELQFLQDSGKVTKTPAKKSNVKKKASPAGQQQQKASKAARNDDSAVNGEATPAGGSTARNVDDMFQSSSSQVRDDEHDEDDDPTPRPQSDAAPDTTIDPSQSGTKTTLDDLMETLKKLEEEETLVKASARKEKNEKPLEWLDELEKSEEDKEQLSAENLDRLSRDNIKKSGFLSDEKLRNIISYLDEVETAERLSEIEQDLTKSNDALVKPALLVPTRDEMTAIEQASAQAAEVTNTMLTQKLELEEKKRSVSMLQKALNQQRELTVRHAKETEKEMKKRLDVQKDEYEETIKRHLSFIDQLIDDKKALSEKCESLVKELKLIDKKYSDKIKSMQENHEIELQKIKEINAAAEKLRREKWIDEKTKKIKEMTVKGLEPEIQRLIAKHKAEIKKIKSVHEAELLASDERAGGRYIRMTEELRDQLAKEKEAACARERELARQTYEKQMQQEEEAWQQQRRRLHAEVQDEKERLSAAAARQRKELDSLQRQLEESHSGSVAAMRLEYEKAREEQENRHAAETKQLKAQLSVEKAAWEENLLKRQETWASAKERELKDSVRRDRDKDIELVIQRLEADNQSAREECERVAENRIKRIRDKYESEMAELERSERLTMEKYNQNKAKLAELEGENERKKVTLKQKDKEVDELKKLLDRLNSERDRVSEVIRQEFADRIVATEEENKRVKNEMSELKARHRLEVEKAKAEVDLITRQKEDEMDKVHERVKQAILKKEEGMSAVREQYQAAVKRADHLEGLLEQQRKQLLGKK